MSDQPETTDDPQPTREEWLAWFQPLFADIRDRSAREGKTPEEVAPEAVAHMMLNAVKPIAVVHGLIILGMIPIQLPPDFVR